MSGEDPEDKRLRIPQLMMTPLTMILWMMCSKLMRLLTLMVNLRLTGGCRSPRYDG